MSPTESEMHRKARTTSIAINTHVITVSSNFSLGLTSATSHLSNLAKRCEISQHVLHINAPTNKFSPVTFHVVKNLRAVLADHRNACQVHQQLASPERVAGALPGLVELRRPRPNDSTVENESSLSLGFDCCDLQHALFFRPLCNRNADAKGDRTQVAEFRMDMENSVTNCQKCRRECR
jgi:hypothetical protein